MNDETQRELPRYQSHKTVWALKIAALKINADQSAGIAPENTNYAPFTTKPGWAARFVAGRTTPDADLGYYVQYQDGFASWSPTKAFEEGYSLEGSEKKHEGLPVAGYRPQSSLAVDLVNLNKIAEEEILRGLDVLAANKDADVDMRWLAIGRTHIEQAWMAINRAIFKPGRVALPGNDE